MWHHAAYPNDVLQALEFWSKSGPLFQGLVLVYYGVLYIYLRFIVHMFWFVCRRFLCRRLSN